jgi:hypothetical protein
MSGYSGLQDLLVGQAGAVGINRLQSIELKMKRQLSPCITVK